MPNGTTSLHGPNNLTSLHGSLKLGEKLIGDLFTVYNEAVGGSNKLWDSKFLDVLYQFALPPRGAC